MEKSFIGLCLISIHALREEGDGHQAVTIMIAADFYPRPPRGGRLLADVVDVLRGDISIHALREEGDVPVYDNRVAVSISIHALREEGDPAALAVRAAHTNFYPRPPRGGRPEPLLLRMMVGEFLSTPSARRATFFNLFLHLLIEFLSTPSARRATPNRQHVLAHTIFLSTPSARRATVLLAGGELPEEISIHALREEGDLHLPRGIQRATISIHALREEGDVSVRCGAFCAGIFLSTPSARRATVSVSVHERERPISIHALREEGDYFSHAFVFFCVHFYPRPPRGGRRCTRCRAGSWKKFLSTPSARRATCRDLRHGHVKPISIHALREEGDPPK